MPPNQRSVVLLLALTAALLLFRLGAVPLIGPDEPRYTRVAVEMHREGSYLVPTLQGRPWLEKPPLYYWLAGAAFSALGETETAARLPSVLAALLLVGSTVFFGGRLHGEAPALHAGFAAATAPLLFIYGRSAAMDMLLAATVTCAVGLLALRLLGLAGPGVVPVAWLFMALATLAKGPLGLLLPGLIVGGYIVATRQWSLARAALSPLGIVLFLLVAGPWYALMWRHQGQAFVDVFLLNHNLQRFTSTIHRHPGPLFYYVPVLLAGAFPWSGLAVAGLGTLRPRGARADVFVLLWLVLPFLFFSAAGSKLPGYILPCLPPLALVTGRAADEMVRGNLRGPLGPRAAAMVTLLLACGVAAAPLYLRSIGEPDWRLAIPFAVWCLLVGLGLRLRATRDPAGAIGLLRVGAAGMLVLLAWAAPPILARRESGRSLFARTGGHEVLVWGAWRTAWMAGYYYNDGRVQEVATLDQITAAARRAPTLVLCGPAERRILQHLAGFSALVLAEGPRGQVLVRLRPSS